LFPIDTMVNTSNYHFVSLFTVVLFQFLPINLPYFPSYRFEFSAGFPLASRYSKASKCPFNASVPLSLLYIIVCSRLSFPGVPAHLHGNDTLFSVLFPYWFRCSHLLFRPFRICNFLLSVPYKRPPNYHTDYSWLLDLAW